MAMNSVIARRAGKSSGAGVGGVLGAIAGAIAAPFTGGASLLAIPAMMGTGQAIGSAVGSVAAPGKSASAEVPVPTGAAERRLAGAPAEESHSAQLEDSLKALHESGDKNLQDAYGEPLFKALTMSMQKKGGIA